ncbi:MAG TPA: hypothetical protein VEC99_03800, partial [Clostridia bacterium]|nr:hypothetical protein [Clostridia bacterium]
MITQIQTPQEAVTESVAAIDTETKAPEMIGSSGGNGSMPETANEKLYLIGRPALKQYLSFVRDNAVEPAVEGKLTEEWNAANSHLRELEAAEAGRADTAPIGKLEPEYEPLLIEFLKDPLVRTGFNTVPTEVAIVELDRLVVYQKHIDLTFV